MVPDQRLDDPAEHAELHDAYRRTIASPERTLLVAELDGEVVGLASLGPRSNRSWVLPPRPLGR